MNVYVSHLLYLRRIDWKRNERKERRLKELNTHKKYFDRWKYESEFWSKWDNPKETGKYYNKDDNYDNKNVLEQIVEDEEPKLLPEETSTKKVLNVRDSSNRNLLGTAETKKRRHDGLSHTPIFQPSNEAGIFPVTLTSSSAKRGRIERECGEVCPRLATTESKEMFKIESTEIINHPRSTSTPINSSTGTAFTGISSISPSICDDILLSYPRSAGNESFHKFY